MGKGKRQKTIDEVLTADAQKVLNDFVARIERLTEERKDIGSMITEVFQKAESEGFDKTTIKNAIKLRKLDDHQRKHSMGLLQTYCHALGMGDLFDWADSQALRPSDAFPAPTGRTH